MNANYSPMTDNVLWYKQEVIYAHNELHDAAIAFSRQIDKITSEDCLPEFSKAACRLDNAAIAFTNTIREYTVNQ